MTLRIALLAWLAVGVTAPAFALTIAELQTLMQAAPARPVEFVEVRESPWLEVPSESRGSLVNKAGALEKRVSSPRKEIWRILPDRLEWEGEAGAVKQIHFAQSPALAPLASALRQGVTGDLHGLQRDFHIDLRGDRRAWAVRLTPLAATAGRTLDHVELEGHEGTLRLITIVEKQGARTTTRLYP